MVPLCFPTNTALPLPLRGYTTCVLGTRGDGGGGRKERRHFSSLPFLAALSPDFDFYIEQRSEECSGADNSVKLILFCLFSEKNCSRTCRCVVVPVFPWFCSCVFVPSGMAVLSMSVQHFLGGLITTLTFTTMMHCTQRAEESIQVKQTLPTASFWRPGLLLFNNLTLLSWCFQC